MSDVNLHKLAQPIGTVPNRVARARRRSMTCDEFLAWFDRKKNNAIYVRAPYQIVPCACGDVNCHGWRFVEIRADQSRASDVEAVVSRTEGETVL